MTAARTLPGRVVTAPAGAHGFDANSPLHRDPATLRVARERGLTFAVRYVGRREQKPTDFSFAEGQAILAAGLALMLVQHVEKEGWTPSAKLGDEYGRNAAAFAAQEGMPKGVCLWLDLEGVRRGVYETDVVLYCRAWYAQVVAAGYVPALYVGWSPGLPGVLLYRLPFKHYWAAYNADGVSTPKPRGYNMLQAPAKALPGVEQDGFDLDVVHTDAKGGTPIWLAPAVAT